ELLPALRSEEVLIRRHDHGDAYPSTTYGIPGPDGQMLMLAHPSRRSVQLLMHDQVLVGTDGARVFPLVGNRTYKVHLSSRALQVVATRGGQRIREFAVMAGDSIVHAKCGVALLNASENDREVLVVSELGWGLAREAQLLPLVENDVKVSPNWITLKVLVNGRVEKGVRVMLCGPEPVDSRILPILADPRVRVASVEDNVSTFFPVVPGHHHVRLVSAVGNVSEVVTTLSVSEEPKQSVGINVDGWRLMRVRIEGMSEVLDFLGRGYISDAQAGSIKRDGKVELWGVGGRTAGVVPTTDIDLPNGLPIADVGESAGGLEADLHSEIAFVSVNAV